ncbi:Uncharacterised protein [Mycobacteroides abscessus subsp. abscessus]|nr:Uncharacterised protein [Mycobacteroides abscessus subsp. abscessus]
MCAASPMSTMLPWRQVRLRTVVKEIHRELLACNRCPSSSAANSSAIRAMDCSSFSPGANSRSAKAAKPASRQTDSCISTMKVLCCALNG